MCLIMFYKVQTKMILLGTSFGIFSFGSFLGWEESWLDVGEDIALGKRDVAEQLAEFIVLLNGQLKMSWSDSMFVTRGITSKFKYL